MTKVLRFPLFRLPNYTRLYLAAQVFVYLLTATLIIVAHP